MKCDLTAQTLRSALLLERGSADLDVVGPGLLHDGGHLGVDQNLKTNVNMEQGEDTAHTS